MTLPLPLSNPLHKPFFPRDKTDRYSRKGVPVSAVPEYMMHLPNAFPRIIVKNERAGKSGDLKILGLVINRQGG